MTHTEHWERIAELAERATDAREAFVPPEEPPDERRATEFLREGVGPAISVYIEARSGDEWTRFPPVEHSLLERSLNDFLELYARCFGYELDCAFSVREAAETLVHTHNVADTARVLTKVPPREDVPTAWEPAGSDGPTGSARGGDPVGASADGDGVTGPDDGSDPADTTGPHGTADAGDTSEAGGTTDADVGPDHDGAPDRER